MDNRFAEIVSLIRSAQTSAYRAVNKELINLYWNVGYYIALKVSAAQWGDKTVDELTNFIQNQHPELKGFNRRGLYRMRQFFETYKDAEMVSLTRTPLQSIENVRATMVSLPMTPFKLWDIRYNLLTEIGWTQHLSLMSRCKTEEERSFYIYLTKKENYTVKELDRQISAAVFERTMLSGKTEPPESLSGIDLIKPHFKDLYIFEFLNLPDSFTENELQKGLIQKLKTFLLELGKDFVIHEGICKFCAERNKRNCQ
jgi:hypothetical protein